MGPLLSAQQQEEGIAFVVKGAERYPAKIAYEVVDAKGERLTVGFFIAPTADQRVMVTMKLPQTFAVQVYEDENNNNELDLGFFGQPLEKYAFSNDAWRTLGRPKLEQQLVKKSTGYTPVNLVLRSVTDL